MACWGGLAALPEFFKRCVTRFVEVNAAQAAAGLAFTSLLTLVPMLTLALLLISRFDLFAGLGAVLHTFLLENLLPEKAGRIIAAYALRFTQKTGGLTAWGTGLLVVSALFLMLSIERVLGRIWQVREQRALLRRIARHLAALILGPVVLGACVAILTYLVTVSLGWVHELRSFTGLSLRILAQALIAVLCALIYFAVPNCPVKWRHALLGGLVAAIGLSLVQRGFSFYVQTFSNYTLIYGAFAAVPLFLVWLYLSWLVVLVGGLVAAVLGEMSRKRRAARH